MTTTVTDNSPIIGHESIEKHSRQRGATLMEIVLVLVVIGVIAVAVFALFGGAFSSSKVRTEEQYLQATAAAVNDMYGTSRDFGTTNIGAILVTNRAVPAPMIVGTGLRNAWNGAITVTGNNDSFTLQTAAIPRKECTELAQISVNPVAVRINGAAQALPMNPATVAGACNAAANTIAWDLR